MTRPPWMVIYTIKVYYTPEVKESVKNIKMMVDQVIATTNSKIPLRVTLHCLEETTKPEAQMADARQVLWSWLHARRS